MNPLYDYVFEIANRMYPTWDTDINDEQYQTDSFRGWDFVHQLEDERLEFYITKERYLENAPIIRSLRAMGLDTEKFWMAMLFVYDVVRERTENVQQVPTSVFEEFRAFARYLQENPDAKVRAWQGREHGVTLESYLTTWQNSMPICQMSVRSGWTDFRWISRVVTRLRLPSNVFCRSWNNSKRKITAVRIPARFPITGCCWFRASSISSAIRIIRNSLIVTKVSRESGHPTRTGSGRRSARILDKSILHIQW